MPENLGGATYHLDVDSGRFTAGTRQAEQSLQRLKTTGDQVGKSNQVLGASLGGIGRTAAAVALGMGGLSIAVTGARTALAGTIDAASAMNETMSKTGVVFGSSAESVKKWSETSARSMGIARQEALETASTFGNLFISLGIGVPKAAELSTSLVELAADLASFNNLDPSDVLIKLRAGLVGEVEPLRTLGVAINEMTVRQKAASLGFKEINGNFTEAEKVQARYALILEHTKTAQGDFARTSDGLANKSRILKAEFQDAGVALGQQLLPAVRLGTGLLGDFFGAFNRANTIENVFPSLATGAVIFGAALGAIKLAQFTTGLVTAAQETITLQRALAAGLGPQPGKSGLTQASAGNLITPNVAILAATAGIVGLDLAARHFTGSGLVDFLTGATEAHNRAAAAAKAQGNTIENLARLSKLGVSDTNARVLELERISQAAAKAEADFQRAKAVAESPEGIRGGFRSRGDTVEQVTARLLREPTADREANLDKAAQNIRDLQLPYVELANFAESHPLLGSRLVPDLKLAYDALVQVKGQVGATADVIRAARDEFSKSLQLASGEFDQADPVVENLKVQLLLLEEKRRALEKLGDTEGIKALDAQIESLHNTIGSLSAPAEIAKQRFQAFGAALLDAAGGSKEEIDKAKEAIDALGNAFAGLTREQRIDIEMKLPLDNMTKLQQFIDLVKANSALGIDIAVRIATAVVTQTPAQQFPGDSSQFLGGNLGNLPGAAEEKAKAVANALGDLAREATELEKETNAASRGAGNAAGAFADAGGAAADAAKDTQIWSDGIIDLSEAMVEGLSAAQVAALENTHDAEQAAFGLADALFRQQVESEKAARGSESLQIGLVEIATELIKSKRTFEEWNLDEILRPKLDAVQSMIDDIFNQPTKESLALDLKKARLEREALLLERGGADAGKVGQKGTKKNPAPAASADDRRLKSVNDQIDAISREIDLRRKDFEIAKLETEMRDKTLASDVDILNANQFLGTALDSLSGSVAATEDALGIRLFGAALKAASALQAVQAAGGTGFTAAEKHWINGVAFNAGEPPPFPGFKWGLDFVPRDNMPALLHYGERVLTRQENQQQSAGGSIGITVNGYGRTDDEILRLVNSETRRGLRQAKGAGASALSHSYAPGRR